MRLDSKRALDYYVGRPMLFLLRRAAQLLALVHDRNHATDPVHTILVVKFQGLGSLMIAKPALAELRRQRPHARIIFWGTRPMLALAEQMPEFDEILILDDRSIPRAARSAASALYKLLRYRIDWALDLEVYSRLSSVLVTLTSARNRTGFAIEQLRSRRVHTHLVYFNRYRHLGEAYARMVGLLLPAGAQVDEADFGSWRFEFQRLPNTPESYIVVNVHAGDLALERRWSRESFEVLIEELLRRRPGTSVILIGYGEAERAYCADMKKGPRVMDLSGILSLTDTFRLLANADLVISNDTAPMHFALSTRAKVVALFGPTRAETYLPRGRRNTAAAFVPLYCSPCVHYWEPLPCRGDNQCMKRLTVAHVLKMCCDLLEMPCDPPMPAALLPGAGEASTYYPGLVYRRPGGNPLE
jgi:ADP-heptose:LPS heptosyltransferase